MTTGANVIVIALLLLGLWKAAELVVGSIIYVLKEEKDEPKPK